MNSLIQRLPDLGLKAEIIAAMAPIGRDAIDSFLLASKRF